MMIGGDPAGATLDPTADLSSNGPEDDILSSTHAKTVNKNHHVTQT